MTTSQSIPRLHHLSRPEGRVTYAVAGKGPLVVAVPGMGDLRSTYDDLAPALVAAGFRVAVTDLRGHGDADTTFADHGDDATAGDLLALVEHLGAPAVLVGNSMGASSAVVAAADRPDLVRALVLVSPFLREAKVGPVRRSLLRLAFRAALARPWGPAAWARYYTGLNKGRRSPRLAAHAAAIRASLREPGRLRSFRDLALALDHSVVEPRLGAVRAPALVVVGDRDPDYADPAAEFAWMRDTLGARGLLVRDTGHYPQHQAPDVVTPAVLDFLASLPATGPTYAETETGTGPTEAGHRG